MISPSSGQYGSPPELTADRHAGFDFLVTVPVRDPSYEGVKLIGRSVGNRLDDYPPRVDGNLDRFASESEISRAT